MGDVVDYWFEEGTHAFKAGIPMDDLFQHFPESKMSPGEWRALERGWLMARIRRLEQSGQARLF